MVAACVSEAADSSISDADHILKPLVGSTVVAEGLTWGSGDKGLGERLTLPYGQTIYLAGTDYKKKHQNGRLVRVVGKLTIQHMKAAPEGAQGYGDRLLRDQRYRVSRDRKGQSRFPGKEEMKEANQTLDRMTRSAGSRMFQVERPWRVPRSSVSFALGRFTI